MESAVLELVDGRIQAYPTEKRPKRERSRYVNIVHGRLSVAKEQE
jgi:hypothetical protein